MTTLTVIHSHSRRKHYAEESHAPGEWARPAICSPYTRGFTPEEWTRRYSLYTSSLPEDQPMCQHCARKAAARGNTP